MERINDLIDRYFEADLSDAEELELKEFLVSDKGQSPEYDEVRAVMCYFAAGRALSSGGRSVLWPRLAAAAAAVALFLTIGIHIYNNNNYCVSYADGVKVTDKEVVMNDVDNILADLFSGRTDMEDQLTDFFGK